LTEIRNSAIRIFGGVIMPFSIEDDKFYRVEELSKITGITKLSIRKMINEKKIPAQKLGREYIVNGKALKDYLTSTKAK